MPRMLIVCGAGLSAPSGIPTFEELRSSGIKTDMKEWNDHTIEFYDALCKTIKTANPNNGHVTISRLQAAATQATATQATASPWTSDPASHWTSDPASPWTSDPASHWTSDPARRADVEAVKIYTMNIDDLLEKAGCKNVIHLHGKIWEYKCIKCNEVRVCTCGENLVRNIILYGEKTDYSDIINDIFELEKEDIFVWIGASGRTANFANIVNSLDCKKLYFNATTASSSCDVSNFIKFYGNCEETLSVLSQFILN